MSKYSQIVRPFRQFISYILFLVISISIYFSSLIQPVAAGEIGSAVRVYANVQIRGYFGKCLDIRGASSNNGTPIQLWSCVDVPQQKWDIWSNGTISSALYPGKCLDLRGPYDIDGAEVQIWDCRFGLKNQQWILDIVKHSDVANGNVNEMNKPNEIRSKFNNRCLDARGPSSNDGTQIQMWRCVNSADNQKFSINKTQLRHDFSLSHVDGIQTNVPVSCWTVVDNDHFCRSVRGHNTRTFYTFAKHRALQLSSHPIYGTMVIADWGDVYEGCSLKNDGRYRCDYKTFDSYDFQTFNDKYWVFKVLWDWARYTGDQASCAASIATLWAAGLTGAKRSAWGFLLASCDHGPYQR